MRNLITDYIIDEVNRTITLPKFANLAESNPFTIANIRLIVNETKQQVICSSMQKSNVSVEGNVITLEKEDLALEDRDQLTIEVDMGDGIVVKKEDWFLQAKIDAANGDVKPFDVDYTMGEQLKTFTQSNIDGVRQNGLFRLMYNTGVRNLDLSSWTEISQENAIAVPYPFASCDYLEEVNLKNLVTISGRSAFDGAFSGCVSLKKIDLSSLRSVVGYAGFDSVFKGCVNLQELILPSLIEGPTGATTYGFRGLCNGCTRLKKVSIRAFEMSNCDWQTAFSGCTNLTIFEANVSALLNSATLNPLYSAVYLTDLYLYGDATNNIYLSWQGALNFNSVCGVLKKLCENTEANGLVCAFKSNFNIDDKTEWTYTDGDGNTTEYNEPNGILATLKAQAEAQGWVINNLTIN